MPTLPRHLGHSSTEGLENSITSGYWMKGRLKEFQSQKDERIYRIKIHVHIYTAAIGT